MFAYLFPKKFMKYRHPRCGDIIEITNIKYRHLIGFEGIVRPSKTGILIIDRATRRVVITLSKTPLQYKLGLKNYKI